MSAAPTLTPEEELEVEKETPRIYRTHQPKTSSPRPKSQVRDLIDEIFKGHEEFLGYSPD